MLKVLALVFVSLTLCAAAAADSSSTTVETTTGPTTTAGTTVTGDTTTAGTTASGATTATTAIGATSATTAASDATTSSSCADDPNTDCTQYTSLCSNAKYAPLLQQFCPKTCGFCGGGSTAAPVACVDSSTNCANWNKNGFCDSTFYTCQQKKDYCAKTCQKCTTTC